VHIAKIETVGAGNRGCLPGKTAINGSQTAAVGAANPGNVFINCTDAAKRSRYAAILRLLVGIGQVELFSFLLGARTK